MNKFTYMTILTNSRYIRGVKALKKSLVKVKSKYKLVILVPKTKENELSELLEKNKIIDNYCTMLTEENIVVKKNNEDFSHSQRWDETFFKLNVARCVSYDKIILLDSDMIVLKNIDHLFECKNYSAAVSGHSIFNEWVKFNSGLLVIDPSNDLYQKLIQCIEPAFNRRLANNLATGDQDVFQEAFPNWEEHKELLLPEKYNAMFWKLNLTCKNLHYKYNDLFVVHFIGSDKPWDFSTKVASRNFLKLGYYFLSGKFIMFYTFLKYVIYSL